MIPTGLLSSRPAAVHIPGQGRNAIVMRGNSNEMWDYNPLNGDWTRLGAGHYFISDPEATLVSGRAVVFAWKTDGIYYNVQASNSTTWGGWQKLLNSF